ncbi:MAG: hypothetical protein HY982_00985, partial [Candidatus Magasanikbacteria bacterium]|nr:hypothetical protein [Candidatus Magasanikbacteria bacterium]
MSNRSTVWKIGLAGMAITMFLAAPDTHAAFAFRVPQALLNYLQRWQTSASAEAAASGVPGADLTPDSAPQIFDENPEELGGIESFVWSDASTTISTTTPVNDSTSCGSATTPPCST